MSGAQVWGLLILLTERLAVPWAVSPGWWRDSSLAILSPEVPGYTDLTLTVRGALSWEFYLYDLV